jgi:drug/metabolite transporter (DMT)-like permease
VAYASGSSTVFSLIHALISNPTSLVNQTAPVYWLSVLNAGFCTFVPMLLIMVAVNRVGPGFAAQASVVGPVATVFLGWFFLDERISLIQILGISVVLVSMWLLLTAGQSVKAAPPHTD